MRDDMPLATGNASLISGFGFGDYFQVTYVHRCEARIIHWCVALQSAMGAPIARKAGPFRLLRTRIRDAFARYDGPYVSVDVLLTWGTTRFAAVDVRHDERTLGTSNYTFRKLVVHAVNMITGFSTLPLQVSPNGST